MSYDCVRVDRDTMNRLRKHVATKTEGRMYGHIGRVVQEAIEEYLNRNELVN